MDAPSELKIHALQIASNHPTPGDPQTVVARAQAYHAFLTGAAVAGKPAAAGAPAGKPATAPAGGKPATAGAPAGKPATAPAGKAPAGKPAAGKAPANPGAAKAPGGVHTQAEVRDAIRSVVAVGAEGKEAAFAVLRDEGGGAGQVGALKPEFYDAVWEACQNIITEAGQPGGDAEVEAAAEFDDPTA